MLDTKERNEQRAAIRVWVGAKVMMEVPLRKAGGWDGDHGIVARTGLPVSSMMRAKGACQVGSDWLPRLVMISSGESDECLRREICKTGFHQRVIRSITDLFEALECSLTVAPT